MGLNRTFTLTAVWKNGDKLSAEEALKIKSELAECCCGGWEGALDAGWLMCFDVSWYDWKEDLGEIAEDHPSVLFTLFCEGETIDDTWQAGFCGDRFDFREAFVPPLDMEFLKGESDA